MKSKYLWVVVIIIAFVLLIFYGWRYFTFYELKFTIEDQFQIYLIMIVSLLTLVGFSYNIIKSEKLSAKLDNIEKLLITFQEERIEDHDDIIENERLSQELILDLMSMFKRGE